ncbi:hypothetical protein, partial [uncultured Bartonella sp.]|uniref:hypothetical protein n=1 Tax=uncultured Bartonella sp. TaxID=104108 RepID=UPI0025FA517C
HFMKSAVIITFKRSSFDVRLVVSIQLLSHSRPHFRAARLSLTNLRLRRLRPNAPLLMYGVLCPGNSAPYSKYAPTGIDTLKTNLATKKKQGSVLAIERRSKTPC